MIIAFQPIIHDDNDNGNNNSNDDNDNDDNDGNDNGNNDDNDNCLLQHSKNNKINTSKSAVFPAFLIAKESSIDFAEQLFPYLMQLFERNYGVWQRAKQVFKSKLLEV